MVGMCCLGIVVRAVSSECFPYDLANEHPHIHLETPTDGGHCGFPMADDKKHSWAEHRALEFLTTKNTDKKYINSNQIVS